MSKYSTIFYKNLNNVAETIVIPTIQNLSLPDSTCIPSRPTVTGDYRNQYVTKAAIKVTINAWLETGKFGEETVNVREVLDKLIYIRDNRIKFNLTTTQSDEESRFLTDLVIENISYNRDAAHRDRLVCCINCTQRKLVDLTWKQASAIDIFGHDIFTDPNTTIPVVNRDFISGITDTDFELSVNKVHETITKLGDISGFSDMPVNRHIRAAISDKVTLDDDSLYYKLSKPIDMFEGTKTYNCNCSFSTRYGVGSDEDAYTLDLGTFVVNVTQKDASIVESFPLTLGYGLAHSNTNMDEIVLNAGTRSSKALKNNSPVSSYPYDFADTYNEFTISKSFEYIEGLEELAIYLRDAQNNGKFTTDMNAASSGAVIVKNDYVWSYKINQRYSFDVTCGTFKQSLTPDGALKIDVFTLTTPNSGFKPVASNDKYQSLWDNSFTNGTNYRISLVVVTLGAMLQLFLFSPTLFNRNRINENS